MSDRKKILIDALDDDSHNALMIRLERIETLARYIRHAVTEMEATHRPLDSATNFLLREIADAEEEQLRMYGGGDDGA